MSDIFLSYQAADRERIGALVSALTYQSWTVWWDREITVGKAWDQVLADALESAKCVVVVWSLNSIKSQWVHNEAEEGMRRGILLPILIDDVKIPLGFKHLQAANLVGWRGDPSHPEFRQLCRGIWAFTHREERRTRPGPGGSENPFPKPNKPNSGDPSPGPGGSAPVQAGPAPKAGAITTEHLAGSFCYLVGPGSLVLLAFRTFSKSGFVRFHAFQASLYFWSALLLFIVGFGHRLIIFLLGFLFWLFVLVATFLGKTIKIPVVHKMAEKLV